MFYDKAKKKKKKVLVPVIDQFRLVNPVTHTSYYIGCTVLRRNPGAVPESRIRNNYISNLPLIIIRIM